MLSVMETANGLGATPKEVHMAMRHLEHPRHMNDRSLSIEPMEFLEIAVHLNKCLSCHPAIADGDR